MPRFLKIKELLETGVIGEVRTVNIRLSQPLEEEEKVVASLLGRGESPLYRGECCPYNRDNG
ncbi:MAG: hypothetical protein ACLFUK_01135 [Halanaerobium sp.]